MSETRRVGEPFNLMKIRRSLALLTRPVRNALAVPVLETFRLLARGLPHGAGLRLGRWIGRGVAVVDFAQHRLARRQLELAGVATGAAARRIGTGIFMNLGQGAVEALHCIHWRPEQMREHVRVEGEENLTAVLGPGSGGLILVSAHMGNWELLGQACHAITGRALAAAMASQNNDLVTRWLIRWREASGAIKLLPGRETLTIVRHLRGGGVLLMLADQDSTRSRGVFTDFFGRPAYTPAGPAHLARRLGLPLLPVVMVRETGDPRQHRLLIGEPILPDPRLAEDADILRMTQAYTRRLEGWIRQYPDQWVWIHDRWRHRPGQKIRVRSAEKRE